MIAAGYCDLSKDYRYKLANRIVQKYESQAGDHRKIFRAVGLGETAIAMGILNLCKTARSEAVKLNAYALAAKCLGLQHDVIEGVEGITIVIHNPSQAQEQGVKTRLAGAHQGTGAPALPIKPLQITK